MSEATPTMSEMGVKTEPIQFPQRYDSYKALVSREQSLFNQAENKGKCPSLEAKYATRFRAHEPEGSWVHVQLRDKDSEAKAEQLTIDGQKIDVVARVWFTGKDAETGKLGAICYKLGADGSVYKQTSEQSRYDKDEGVRYWTLGETQKVDEISEKHELYSRMAKLQVPAQKAA